MIDACSQESRPLLSIDDALGRIKTAVNPVNGTEKAALKNALGRVLAESVYSPVNIPHDRNAAMDGYAFASRDMADGQAFTLALAGTSWAGRPFQGQLQAGQCVRIFTGAVVPEQADSVIMQEHVQVQEQTVHFPADTRALQNVRKIGEDVKQGECLIAQPKKLTAVDLGLLASAGIDEVTVKRQLKIAHFSTGDELTSLGRPLESGKIYDSNRAMLGGLLSDPGYSVVDLGVIPDNKQLLEDRFIEASLSYDVIITTGGASVGEADYVKEILQSCGEVNFWKIAIKPGKPLAFGKIGQCHFFGLPGNPVAVVVTFQQIVAPALRQLSGAPSVKPLRFTATCTSALKKSPGRQEYQRGILSQDENGEFFVASAGQQGSHILSSMSQSGCYIVLPEGCKGVQAGDRVTVEPFSLLI
ncbi:molybdopterin molybdotransferase MoeA [Methylobacter tundripaludum]|uniref:Molybdopterin molybdenumtransferase n=1 Tax=Methylobacter tundripaludum (strain ATCC BAA-1195 / DSM 17260 / SV96) TaxID=697282 RepID=G3IY91_METTV|nr:gephyrin-like molybdotransferase Glp [Methylobacter tundripaludum]EGW20013.1 molybdenum cofactor synthesis domain protein [Methylobacter tundripaludum SV96]